MPYRTGEELFYHLCDKQSREYTIFDLYCEHRANGASASLSLKFIRQLEVLLDYCDKGRPLSHRLNQIPRIKQRFGDYQYFRETIKTLAEGLNRKNRHQISTPLAVSAGKLAE